MFESLALRLLRTNTHADCKKLGIYRSSIAYNSTAQASLDPQQLAFSWMANSCGHGMVSQLQDKISQYYHQ